MKLYSATSKSPKLASVPLVSLLSTKSSFALQRRNRAEDARAENATYNEDVDSEMLSFGGPQFGEMLNYAAQWPDADGLSAELESMFEDQNDSLTQFD
jgi:hypothetical protein